MSQFPNNSIDYSLTFYVMYVCIHLLKMGFRSKAWKCARQRWTFEFKCHVLCRLSQFWFI